MIVKELFELGLRCCLVAMTTLARGFRLYGTAVVVQLVFIRKRATPFRSVAIVARNWHCKFE